MKERQKQLDQLCKDYGVRALYVFGSRAHDIQAFLEDSIDSVQYGESDADIAILSMSRLSVDKKVKFALAVEDILNAPRVDLVILNDADPFLAANAIRGERLYALDSYEADEYELYVLRRAGDLAFFERERMSLVLEEKV